MQMLISGIIRRARVQEFYCCVCVYVCVCVFLQSKLADVSKDFKDILELRTEVCESLWSTIPMWKLLHVCIYVHAHCKCTCAVEA